MIALSLALSILCIHYYSYTYPTQRNINDRVAIFAHDDDAEAIFFIDAVRLFDFR